MWLLFAALCRTESGRDGCRSNLTPPALRDSAVRESCDFLNRRCLWWAGNGWRLRGTSKRPGGDLAPSQGHNQHCSTINPSLLYYFQIIFKWVKSLWGIKTLPNPPPPPISQHFNGGCAILSGWGWQRLRTTLRRWSAAATGQCENCDTRGGTTNMSSNLLSERGDK